MRHVLAGVIGFLLWKDTLFWEIVSWVDAVGFGIFGIVFSRSVVYDTK